MKKTGIFLLLLASLTGACNKKSNSSGSTVVQYQVIATNSSALTINYNNVLEQKIMVNAYQSWAYDITLDQKPFHAYIQAASTSPFGSLQTSCTVNILVNGSVVKTATVSSNTTAVAVAEYIVQ